MAAPPRRATGVQALLAPLRAHPIEGRIHHLAILDHHAHVFRGGDIGERISLDDGEVGQLPW
jgi:hypothetical protein